MSDLIQKLREEEKRHLTRRWFFRDCGVGLGAAALGSLLNGSMAHAEGPTDPLAPKAPHFPAKAKRVIFLFQAGAPSHLAVRRGALLRLVHGPSAQDRVLALDFVYVVGMLVMLVLAIRTDSSMYFEGALLMVLFGFVGSVAMAKFLLRGEAIE